MILKLLYSGTFFLNWQYGLGDGEEWWECCPSLPAPILGNSGTVTASCPQLCTSVAVTRGSEWRELELDCVGLTFPLFTPFVRGSCNRSVNQTSIINIKDTKHWHASYVWSFYRVEGLQSLQIGLCMKKEGHVPYWWQAGTGKLHISAWKEKKEGPALQIWCFIEVLSWNGS